MSHDTEIRRRTLRPARQIRGGLAQRVKPDAQLAAVIGDEPAPRGEITKRIWDYIKKNSLQDPANKRMINADDKLDGLFEGRKQVSMFDLTKLVNRHVSVE